MRQCKMKLIFCQTKMSLCDADAGQMFRDDQSKVQHQSDIRRCSCWVCLWSDQSVKASRCQKMNRLYSRWWWWSQWWRVWSENLTSLLTSESNFTGPSGSHHTRNHKHISDYPHVHFLTFMHLLCSWSITVLSIKHYL